MSSLRSEILEWARQGRIAPGDLRNALEAGGALPDAQAWRRFLDRLLLFMGTVMLAAALVFFLAYNWQALGRFGKFALAEGLIVAGLAVVWWRGLERLSGQAVLLFSALAAGALLALVGQVYQTGADTFELFAAWAVAIAPWVLLARFPTLWILWLAVVNVACALYFDAFPGALVFFGPERQLWALFFLNTAALAAWEASAAGGLAWLRERWTVRLVATASGAFATAVAIESIFDDRGAAWGVAAWAAWLVAAYLVYRRTIKDLYVLAGGALSAIVVVAAFLADSLRVQDAGALLFIGLVVVAMSAAAGVWLRLVAAEERR